MRAATTITVGSHAPQFNGHGIWIDGQSGRPRRVALSFDDDAGEMVIDNRIAWPFQRIRRLRDQADPDRIVLRSADDRVGRLVLERPEELRVIETRARRLNRAPPPNVPLARIVAWAAAALASVALIIFVLVPVMADRLAGFLPLEGERALGEATFEQIRRALGDEFEGPLSTCDAPEGQAALIALQERLLPHADLAVPVTLRVLDHEMVNAFALPGGQIVVFRGLIDAAGTAEEVTAVLAHEMGHVAARDPTRIALRSAGSIGVLGLLLGDFAGGAVVLALTNQLIQADYTREAEAAADTYAHRVLLDADLPPEGIATFFERLAGDAGAPTALEQHFLSHPAMGDRIAAARAATPDGRSFAPALTEAEWAALQAICEE